jgi:hypothetical protein
MIAIIFSLLFPVRPVIVTPRDQAWHDRRRAILSKLHKELNEA